MPANRPPLLPVPTAQVTEFFPITLGPRKGIGEGQVSSPPQSLPPSSLLSWRTAHGDLQPFYFCSSSGLALASPGGIRQGHRTQPLVQTQGTGPSLYACHIQAPRDWGRSLTYFHAPPHRSWERQVWLNPQAGKTPDTWGGGGALMVVPEGPKGAGKPSACAGTASELHPQGREGSS
jgi:hypothetical protein